MAGTATSIPNSPNKLMMGRSTPLPLQTTPARLSFSKQRRKLSMSAGNLSSRGSTAAVRALMTARESEMKPRILVSEKLGDAELDLLRSYGDVECLYNLSLDDLLAIGEFDALIVRSVTEVPRELFEIMGEKLKVVGCAGVGINNANVLAATRNGCLVVNVPTANTIAAAEQVIALLAGMARKAGSLVGKTLAVKCFDKIGIEIVRLAKGLGMHVIVHDPYAVTECVRIACADAMALNDAFSKADFILLHNLPDASTSKIFNAPMFRIMKKGVGIICHGGHIDEDDLLVAINDGTVSQVEVLPPLSACSNTEEEEEEEEEEGKGIAIDVVRALKGELPATLVNAPTCSAQVLTEMRPYFVLAEKLGRVASQLVKGRNRVKYVKIKYMSSRALGDLDRRLLQAMITKGLIETNWGDFVNIVNADYQAEVRRLKIFEESSIILDGSPEIPLKLVQIEMFKVKSKFESACSDCPECRKIIVEGRVKDGIPYLTKVGLFEVETSLEGRENLLLCRQVGQATPSLMAIRVDGELNEQLLKRIGISADDEFIYLTL